MKSRRALVKRREMCVCACAFGTFLLTTHSILSRYRLSLCLETRHPDRLHV